MVLVGFFLGGEQFLRGTAAMQTLREYVSAKRFLPSGKSGASHLTPSSWHRYLRQALRAPCSSLRGLYRITPGFASLPQRRRRRQIEAHHTALCVLFTVTYVRRTTVGPYDRSSSEPEANSRQYATTPRSSLVIDNRLSAASYPAALQTLASVHPINHHPPSIHHSKRKYCAEMSLRPTPKFCD